MDQTYTPAEPRATFYANGWVHIGLDLSVPNSEINHTDPTLDELTRYGLNAIHELGPYFAQVIVPLIKNSFPDFFAMEGPYWKLRSIQVGPFVNPGDSVEGFLEFWCDDVAAISVAIIVPRSVYFELTQSEQMRTLLEDYEPTYRFVPGKGMRQAQNEFSRKKRKLVLVSAIPSVVALTFFLLAMASWYGFTSPNFHISGWWFIPIFIMLFATYRVQDRLERNLSLFQKAEFQELLNEERQT